MYVYNIYRDYTNIYIYIYKLIYESWENINLNSKPLTSEQWEITNKVRMRAKVIIVQHWMPTDRKCLALKINNIVMFTWIFKIPRTICLGSVITFNSSRKIKCVCCSLIHIRELLLSKCFLKPS